MTDDVGKLAEKTFVHYYERRRREGGPGTAGYEWGQLTADLQAAGLAIVSSVDSRLPSEEERKTLIRKLDHWDRRRTKPETIADGILSLLKGEGK